MLPQNLNGFPTRGYLKYLPKYHGEGEVIVEEHLASFYNIVDNQNIKHQDVWMRLFVQSLDGEARKWFRGIHAQYIARIEALDDSFLNNLGDKKNTYII